MKLCRYGLVGEEKPGLIGPDGQLRDLSGVLKEIGKETLSPEGLRKLSAIEFKSLPTVDRRQRFGVPYTGM